MTHQLNNHEGHEEHQGIINDKLLKIFHLKHSDIRNPTFDIFKTQSRYDAKILTQSK